MSIIRVGNLRVSVTMDEIRAEFSEFGNISSVAIVLVSGLPCAFIEFLDRQDAQDAIWRYCKNGWAVELVRDRRDGGENANWRYGHGWTTVGLDHKNEEGYDISPDHYRHTYEEVKKIGEGASGEVFECVSKIDGQTYGIKKIKKPDFGSVAYEDFRREVRLMEKVQGPNVVRYYESWIEEGVEDYITISSGESESDTPTMTSDVKYAAKVGTRESFFDEKGYTLYIAMEFCPETLESKIEDELSIGIKLDYARQIVDGLKHIHSKNVIHMDIWPKNILIDSSGKIKITDFGLAVGVEEMEPFRAHFGGHRYYIAPELKVNAIISTKADIFSAGMVIFGMLHPMKTRSYRKRTFLSLQDGTYQDKDDVVLKFLCPFINVTLSLRETAESIIETRLLYPNRKTKKQLRRYWNKLLSR